MKIIFHGELRERFGESFTMNCSTVADVLEGLSRQLENFPTEMSIQVVGFDTDESLFADTDVEEVHVIPAMFGGGGDIGRILVGAALVVVGVLLLPIAPQIGVALIVSGGLMILQGVIGLFTKAPTTDKTEDSPASKYLGTGRNTTAIGTPQTLAWGRVLLAGHFLSVQTDSNALVLGTFPVNPT